MLVAEYGPHNAVPPVTAPQAAPAAAPREDPDSGEPAAEGGVHAQRVQCASNMRQIGIALNLYASENKGKMVNAIRILSEFLSKLPPDTPIRSGSAIPRSTIASTPAPSARRLKTSVRS